MAVYLVVVTARVNKFFGQICFAYIFYDIKRHRLAFDSELFKTTSTEGQTLVACATIWLDRASRCTKAFSNKFGRTNRREKRSTGNSVKKRRLTKGSTTATSANVDIIDETPLLKDVWFVGWCDRELLILEEFFVTDIQFHSFPATTKPWWNFSPLECLDFKCFLLGKDFIASTTSLRLTEFWCHWC